MLQLQLLLPLLCLGPIAAGLSLQNGTMLSGDGNAAGNVNLPTLGNVGLGNGSLSSAGINSGGSGGGGGGGGGGVGIGMNLPLGGGGGGVGSQSNQELSGSGNTLGTGGSSAGTGGAAGSSNNSALLQAPKEKQYERCTGPGDPGPCKQYIYKWRYEPSTSECTTFIWGGCDGNPHNRFSTEAECLYHCIGGPRKRIIEGESLSNPYFSLFLADTLPPFLQSTTREPSTTESSLSSYTPSSAQLPGGAGGYGAGMGIGGAGGGGAGGAGGGGNSGVYGMGTTPVPIEQRGPELTFAETGQDKTFVFAKNNTFIQMDGDIIQTFQLR